MNTFKRGEVYNPYGLPQVRAAVRACPWIAPGEYRAWDALVDRAGQDGNCFPNAETIAADIGGSVDHSRRLIRELEKKNLIRRSERFHATGRQTSNTIAFVWIPLDELRAPVVPDGKVGKSAQVGKDAEGEVCESAQDEVGKSAHPLTNPYEPTQKESVKSDDYVNGTTTVGNEMPIAQSIRQTETPIPVNRTNPPPRLPVRSGSPPARQLIRSVPQSPARPEPAWKRSPGMRRVTLAEIEALFPASQPA